MDTAALVVSIVGAAIGATWVLRSKLSDVAEALREHAASDAANLKEIKDNVVQLRARSRRR